MGKYNKKDSDEHKEPTKIGNDKKDLAIRKKF